jgi:hypothetical protein
MEIEDKSLKVNRLVLLQILSKIHLLNHSLLISLSKISSALDSCLTASILLVRGGQHQDLKQVLLKSTQAQLRSAQAGSGLPGVAQAKAPIAQVRKPKQKFLVFVLGS